jgi:aryl-alcohol dehydrogenase-like predicted oxidoreductase
VFGWTIDQDGGARIMDAFRAGGGRMIDTADSYCAFLPGKAGGESETIIGAWMKARNCRTEMMIATKVGNLPGTGGKGLKASRIMAAADESLARLQTDYIDLYFAHDDDPETPIEETLDAFDRLVRAGKVRAIAASNFTPERLGRSLDTSAARGLAVYQALQPHYNLVERGFERTYRPICVEHDLGVLPYFGLAGGFLTGKYRSAADTGGRTRGGYVEQYLNGGGLAVLDALDAVAAETGATATQVALAWLAAQPTVVAPIASATSVEQCEELVGSMALDLSAELCARLGAASLATGAG